jgi:hypothetical protein
MHLEPRPTPEAAMELQTALVLCSLAISHEPTAIVARLRKMATLLVTTQIYDWVLRSIGGSYRRNI